MRHRGWMVLLVLLVLGGCQTRIDRGVQCMVEPGALSEAQTFSWLEGEPVKLRDPTGYVSPLAVERLKGAVQAELEGKGLRLFDPSTDLISDLAVSLTLRTRRELVGTQSSAVDCTQDCEGAGGVATRMDIRTIGFLAADVYQADLPVWHAWVETTLYPENRDQVGQVIARVVPALLADFPP